MKKKNTNNLKYAVWIDQQKAMVACLDEEGNITVETTASEIETHVRFDGESSSKSRLFGATLNKEKQAQNKLNQQRTRFLKGVVAQLKKVDSVIIMGPADTKYELHKELEKKKSLAGVRVEIKSADKMKVHEIKAVLKPGAVLRSAPRKPRS